MTVEIQLAFHGEIYIREMIKISDVAYDLERLILQCDYLSRFLSDYFGGLDWCEASGEVASLVVTAASFNPFQQSSWAGKKVSD